MKLTKYIHSCVLLEKDGEQLLIDPGMFTFQQGVTTDTFKDVDTILITHNHPDHVDPASIKAITGMSSATIVTTPEIVKVLTEAGVEATFVTDLSYETTAFTITAIPADHEKVLADQLPQNYAYLINGSVLAVGDSFAKALTEIKGVEVLMLPIMAPWTTELGVFEFAKTVHPAHVIPVHDGYAKDFFLKSRYANYEKYFEKEGIMFDGLMSAGESLTI